MSEVQIKQSDVTGNSNDNISTATGDNVEEIPTNVNKSEGSEAPEGEGKTCDQSAPKSEIILQAACSEKEGKQTQTSGKTQESDSTCGATDLKVGEADSKCDVTDNTDSFNLKCDCDEDNRTNKTDNSDGQTSSSSSTTPIDNIDEFLTDNSIDSQFSDNNTKDENLKVELPPLSAEAHPKTETEISELNEAGEGASASPSSTDGNVYHVKWIAYKNKEIPTITQNENGPCPLIAVMNVLLLKCQVHLPPNTEVITPDQLMTYIGNCILENAPKTQDTSEAVQLNYQQNMHDAMAVIHKLQTGLDVNVRFTGVNDFEYTPECIIFDLLSIPLYHGWLVDPQEKDLITAIGTCSYNQLVEKIISQRSSDKPETVTEALLCESFLDGAAAQLTYHGLCELNSVVKENQLCVFFRNNHFSTMYRHQNELFLLVTDQGFLSERNVVWETLSNVEGDGYFVDANFNTYRKSPPAEPVLPPTPMNPEEQVDQDYLLAMSLQHEQQLRDEEIDWNQDNGQRHDPQRPQMSDHELAARMQADEDKRLALAVRRQEQQQQQRQQQPTWASGGGTPQHHHAAHGGRPRERERTTREPKSKDKECCIL
ncbi:ubiquitin carboxyl-terminal hydrolase MINDY-1-like isoform X2 [Mizuhopecten yessoensis]|uniref:Ubiquitin carboxyl-terminal hydrolase n=1 Tax=Mizuhopecten yessoensis TaxID=6573 RepID=A0A210QGQ9_MIZYE|nr:ubiquitin carboxyl-terminal hydrolase MINDY-1-like isoform X2 [Mizuhopecten yessoensis]OWF47944.1 Protein FAM63B [Mizuhopecten yessoensis]